MPIVKGNVTFFQLKSLGFLWLNGVDGATTVVSVMRAVSFSMPIDHVALSLQWVVDGLGIFLLLLHTVCGRVASLVLAKIVVVLLREEAVVQVLQILWQTDRLEHFAIKTGLVFTLRTGLKWLLMGICLLRVFLIHLGLRCDWLSWVVPWLPFRFLNVPKLGHR